MKQIILDHFRRWRWIWLVGGLGCQALAVLACFPDKHANASQFFPAIIFLGPFLLSIDLQRGHARALLAMPVTIRQIARAWWLVSVGIPSLILAIMGVVAFVLISIFAHTSPSIAIVLNCWMVNSLLLGIMFFALSGLPTKGGIDGDWIERARGILFGLVWGGTLGGWYLFSKIIVTETAGGLVFVAVAAILSIIGWFRAETLVQERAGLRQRIASKSTKPSRCINGYGGLRYLSETLLLRMLRMGLWFFAVFTFFITLMAHGHSHGNLKDHDFWTQNFSMFTFQFLWFMSFQLAPVSLHLRFLRTLPVSASKLAALLVFTPIVAMVATLCLANVFLALAFGSTPVSLLHMIQNGWLIQIATASLFIPMLVWRGMDRLTYLITMMVMIVGISSSVFFRGHDFMLIGNILAPVFILGTYLLTRYLLERGNETYRPRINQLTGWSWSSGR